MKELHIVVAKWLGSPTPTSNAEIIRPIRKTTNSPVQALETNSLTS